MRLLLVCILFYTPCHGQEFIKNISKSVGLITFVDKTNNQTSYGTGTLMYKQVHDDSSFRIFLVTCKHVLPTKIQADSIIFFIRKEVGNISSFVGVKIEINTMSGVYTPIIKTDPSGNDVAVLNLSSYIEPAGMKYLLPSIIPYKFLVPKDSIDSNDIYIGSDVMFVGYPSLFFDSRNISPILRSGVIATQPNEHFYFNNALKNNYHSLYKLKLPEKFPGFLIDASAFGGSSGSLVFTKPTHFSTRNNELYYKSTEYFPRIIGIMSDSFLDVSTAGHKLNLGGIILSQYIIDTINLFDM